MHQMATSAWGEVTLNRCPAPHPVPVVTTVAPVRAHLYLAVGDCLYAVHAADGTARWCQRVNLIRPTRTVPPPPTASLPPPPRVAFGTPRVGNGVVYVCVYGAGEYTCAFNAADGSLRWRTSTDARVASMPFLDFAVPLVKDGIVYSGTYALNEQDGSVRWRSAINTLEEGTFSLHAVTGETVYATSHRGIYAINAHDGQIRWLYQPDAQTSVSGPPVVSGQLLYAGTSGYFCALDVETGEEVWRYPMVHYSGAVIQHETIYVSGGRFLYALDKSSGMLRWRHLFAAPGHYPATVADNVLYIATDGAYALSSEDGAVLWHQPVESSPNVSFRQPVILDSAVYLVRIDARGQGTLYALNTRTGAEYWHTPYSSALGVAQ